MLSTEHTFQNSLPPLRIRSLHYFILILSNPAISDLNKIQYLFFFIGGGADISVFDSSFSCLAPPLSCFGTFISTCACSLIRLVIVVPSSSGVSETCSFFAMLFMSSVIISQFVGTSCALLVYANLSRIPISPLQR